MYTVTEIENIDEATFDGIYEGDKARISTAIGYDDIDHLKTYFLREDSTLFQAVDSSNQVMAYIMGQPMEGKVIRIVHMVTRAADTIFNFVEPSATLLKTLGFDVVHFCVKLDGSSYVFCKNNLNRSDVYEYFGETLEYEGYTDIQLKLL